jgi:hypothetical protein
VLQDGQLVGSIDSVSSFNGNTMLEIKEDGFLGEPTNRFDEVLNGFGGDFEMQVTGSAWINFELAVLDRATRRVPGTVFNVVRTDLYPNGDSAIYTYKDVHWGEIPAAVGGRAEFVKVKASFKCSERPVQVNALP